MNKHEIKSALDWMQLSSEVLPESWFEESGRTTTFQTFMESLNESSVRKAKVKFGKEWGEEK